MNDASYWQKQTVEVTRQYFILQEALNEIIIAPSDKEPFNTVDWYKNVAKRALEEKEVRLENIIYENTNRKMETTT